MAFLSDNTTTTPSDVTTGSLNTYKGTAQTRYEELSQDRQAYLDRARACSRLTIPYLIPPDALAQGQALPLPYQSVGASGVTNLASKLLITMLPPNEPCFRLRVDNLVLEQNEEEADKEFRTKIERALSRVEQAVLGDIESTGDRPVVYEGNLHLLVGGNVLYHDSPDSGLRLFPLSRFVIDRDPMGTPVEIIVEENVSVDVLPERFVEQLRQIARDHGSVGGSVGGGIRAEDKAVTLYTHLQRQPTQWTVYQECGGVQVPDTEGSYKLDACPWIPVRMYAVAGENYGRSYVELHQADLSTLESLSKAILEGSAASAKVMFFVNPNSVTSAAAVAEAPNGAVLEGRADDVTALQVQKHADLQVASAQVQDIINRLKTSFLMLDAIRRDAERVTAEEIRAVAQELETSLGGVYTVISQEFQLPYISHRMASMTRKKRLPELPKGVVRPSVITGFEALGRGTDKAKLMEFLSIGQQTLGPAFLNYLNPLNAITRLASSMGIPTEGLIKDEEQLMQEQQQAQQQQQMQMMVDKLGPEAMRMAGDQMTQQPSAAATPASPGMAGGGGNNGGGSAL